MRKVISAHPVSLLHSIQRQEKANNNLHTPYERNNLAVTPVWKRFTRLSQQQLFTGGGQEPAEAAFC